MSFESLKRSRGNFSELREKIQQQAKPSYGDDRFWKLSVDKNGKGSATIRFLPTTSGEANPFVIVYKHSFKNKDTDKWFIENCHTTIGESCPCCDHNTQLWDTGLEANQNIVRQRKRKKSFIANILVQDDPANPENNGKVMLFEFGSAIFNFIKDAIDPEFDDQEAVNVFDLWEGADFVLRAYNRDDNGMRSYDKSEFKRPSMAKPTDKELEEVYNSQYKLLEFHDPTKFKPYAEVQANFNRVIGVKVEEKSVNERMEGKSFSNPMQNNQPSVQNYDGDEEQLSQVFSTSEPVKETETTQSSESNTADEEDPMEAYRRLIGS